MKKHIPIVILTAVVLLLGWFVLVTIPGCSTDKHIQKTEITKDSTVEKEQAEIIRYLQDHITHLESYVREMDYAGVVFDSTKCPKITIPESCKDTTLRRLVDELNEALDIAKKKVKIYADGTIEAEGNLKSASRTKEMQAHMIANLRTRVDSFAIALEAEKSNVKTKIVEKEKTVERKWLTGFWLWILFLVIGFVLGKKFGNKIPFIKNL